MLKNFFKYIISLNIFINGYNMPYTYAQDVTVNKTDINYIMNASCSIKGIIVYKESFFGKTKDDYEIIKNDIKRKNPNAFCVFVNENENTIDNKSTNNTEITNNNIGDNYDNGNLKNALNALISNNKDSSQLSFANENDEKNSRLKPVTEYTNDKTIPSNTDNINKQNTINNNEEITNNSNILITFGVYEKMTSENILNFWRHSIKGSSVLEELIPIVSDIDENNKVLYTDNVNEKQIDGICYEAKIRHMLCLKGKKIN